MNPKNLILSISLLTVSWAATAWTDKKITRTFPVKGAGKWDYITVSGDKLYVSHGTTVHILDKASGREIKTIDSLSGVHGIAIDPTNNRGYISNGKGNNVVVFDLKNYKVLTHINTGNNPDFITLEPFSHTIITGNGKSNSLSVIDPETMTVKATIDIGGKPEAIVSDKAGKAYVNLEDKSEIVVIDTRTFKAGKHIRLAPAGEAPTGLAIDEQQHLLFAGCGNQKLIIVQTGSDKIIGTMPIGEGCDAVVYSPATKTIYTANGDGTISRIKVSDGEHFKALDPVITRRGARTIARDEATDALYLPVADLSGQKDAAGKPVYTPGSFKVLVVK